ncbi:MAG: nucleoside triphosphate pyrophosphohydrolase [Flavobacteriales bacterium]|nr:nucleoside triphosphate pyrophosphohydrolase [Flavobacteriales bacterium]|tara:strand:+ start:12339 stop:13103 length:765 start_codon:yes stop_codon:yes gene_type:complete
MEDLKKDFEELVSVMFELREKCPWDKKQTLQSLRYLTIEECYELSDAILNEDYDDIKEELGDILLHVIFYSVLAQENKKFQLSDVIKGQTKKLIYRHPHIYSNLKVKDEKEVKKNWELLKLKKNKNKSVLSGVPQSLPTMLKSYRIQEKVKGVGFDFKNNLTAFDKILEEIEEFKLELENNNIQKAEEEFGDILFSLIGYAQRNGINSLNALEKTNKKFLNRFHKMEKLIKKKNKNISDYSIDQLDFLWNSVKK